MMIDENIRVTPVKCHFKKEAWYPCGPLKLATNAKRRAFSMGFMFNFGLGSANITMFPQLHTGEFKKRPIALNYCPFCGTSLKRLYKAKKS